MYIGDRKIGPDCSPLIIAEMSGNHNKSLDRALDIVEVAARSGAHAIKLQTYTADTITLDIKEREFLIDDERSPWNGHCLHELYESAHTPWEWHATIFDRAAELGICCFSTPFDETAVDFLEGLKAPAYKIASFEINHLPLIRKVAETGKPIIMSTGMASITEIGEAVGAARNAGCEDIVLLKCTSTYPADPEHSNILTIPHMRELFDCEVGLSDHTMGCGSAMAAIAHGATVIEKHLTISRSEGGIDSTFSMEPHELESLVLESERAWKSLGSVKYGPGVSETASLSLRRSLYISKDVAEGETLTEENLRCVRPGLGLPPKYYDLLIGRKTNRHLKVGTPMSWDYV